MENNQREFQSHSKNYLEDIANIALSIDSNLIEKMVDNIVDIKNVGGRVFCLGVGGGAANASHAVNDFRKLCEIEAYTPTDNIAELTARTNDEGWETIFEEWLRISKVTYKDIVFIFSVGGGSVNPEVSINICRALNFEQPFKIGIVGRNGGYTKQVGDNVIVIPTLNPDLVTAYTESFQMIILHAIVFHPKLLINKGKWESIDNKPLSYEAHKRMGT